MLTDNQALDLLIDFYEHFYSNSEEFVYIIDTNYRVIKMNEYGKNTWDPKYIAPFTDSTKVSIIEYFWPAQFSNLIKSIYQKIETTRKSLSVIAVNFWRKPEFAILIFYYEPIINKDTGNLIAILCRGSLPKCPLLWLNFPKNFKTPDNQTRLASKDEFLTVREHEIIFLMFHFNTYEDIAMILSLNYNQRITKNAIGKFVRHYLYPKFNVIDLRSLRLKAADLRYNKKIPLSLMSPIIIELEEL